jgi:long-chain-fatty-acid--CoA ligase ACSBG
LFFAVPRIWEKFEEKLKEIGASKPAILQSVSAWAKTHGTAAVQARLNKEEPGLMYSVAHALILSKIKSALGLD